MATDKHRCLADFIKSTHATLRQEARDYGPDAAWKWHLTRHEHLQKYAASMRELATVHWKETMSNENSTPSRSRIDWILSQCKQYFFSGGKEKYDQRELQIYERLNNGLVQIDSTEEVLTQSIKKKPALLDVGSCYNPFGTEEDFDVTAIDLMGADNSVFQCDYLNMSIGDTRLVSSDNCKIVQLPRNAFDAVIFSLFLEYLPCPKQRYLCCQKAYTLLKPTGILVIVSPDSNHVNANAKLIKSWRYNLSKMGLMRIRYEKLQHVHCLIFRKCKLKEVAIRWANLQSIDQTDLFYQDETSIYIPQDFQNKQDQNAVCYETGLGHYDEDDVSSAFTELPYEVE